MQQFYNNDDIQRMLDDCKKNKSLANKILKQMPNDADRRALASVFQSGWVEDFDRYDSAVCEYFVGLYDLIKSNSSVDFLFKESVTTKSENYKGYDIEYNIYNQGEYTVQYEGDDVFFKTKEEAKKFIDGLDGVNESKIGVKGYKDYELELEFDVKVKPELPVGDFDKIIDFVNNYFNGKGKRVVGDMADLFGCGGLPVGAPVVQQRDIDYKNQKFYLLIYPHFEGKIEWDQDGIGQSFWEFDGAPTNEEQPLYWDSIKNIVRATPGLSVDLGFKDISVKWIGKDLDFKVADLVEYEQDRLADESIVKDPVNAIIEGKDIRKVIFETAFAQDSFGYDLATTIRYELGDAARENINRETAEGFYEYLFDGSDEQRVKFERSVKRLQKKFPGYSFEGKLVERFNGEPRYLLNVKAKSAIKEDNEFPEILAVILDRFGIVKRNHFDNRETCEGWFEWNSSGLEDIFKKYTKDIAKKFPEYEFKGQFRKTSGDPVYRLTVKLKSGKPVDESSEALMVRLNKVGDHYESSDGRFICRKQQITRMTFIDENGQKRQRLLWVLNDRQGAKPEYFASLKKAEEYINDSIIRKGNRF